MSTLRTPRTLGAQFPPAYDRPFLRYFNDDVTAPGGDTTPPAGTPAPAAPAATSPAPAGDEAPWKAEDFDSERAWKKIQAQKADLEAERAKRAQAVKDAETAAEKRAAEKAYKEIGKSLGVVSDDETPTVEGLSQALQQKDATLTTRDAENQALRIENAILRHASRFGGDADALTDSESFKKKLKDLDPTAENHASEVERLVKEAIESNTRYRKVQVTPSNTNGNPAPSGSPTGGQLTREQLAALSPEDRLKAAKEGRLNGLLGKK